jgi:hypothetical protein
LGHTSNGDAVKIGGSQGKQSARFPKKYVDELPLTLAPPWLVFAGLEVRFCGKRQLRSMHSP